MSLESRILKQANRLGRIDKDRKKFKDDINRLEAKLKDLDKAVASLEKRISNLEKGSLLSVRRMCNGAAE